MRREIQINPKDNVAVALTDLAQGEQIQNITLRDPIPAGHKFALSSIEKGESVIKYGMPIGKATAPIPAGAWVHTHNLRTALSERADYTYSPTAQTQANTAAASFNGYLRPDGHAGIRNELWIIPTVGCVNDICKVLEAESAHLADEYGLDGVYHFPHPYGCSQLGGDHAATREILAALCRHPNAGGVLVVGLGCENNRLDEFEALFSPEHLPKLRFMSCQEADDEISVGTEKLRELAEYASDFKRQALPISKLIVGMKCGGSDGFSGITANPLVGALSDKLISMGGSTILTEVPEMFGAETPLFNRCIDETVFEKAVNMVNGFKEYFTSHQQPVYENPSPGNKDGGITTLEDKSIGCIQKGGAMPVVDVLNYGGSVTKHGLNLLYGPGNDLVSATALTAAGAQLILFTTGRGTPFGAPVPTLKIASNSTLADKKSHWIDFNAGVLTEGKSISDTTERLFDLIHSIANGKSAKNEEYGQRGIAIWKNGVTL